MNTAIIVAGGTGTRMNSSSPKQFLLLKDIPVLFYSITAFFRFDASLRILLALPEPLFNDWIELQKRFNLTIPHELVSGGETRFHSVFNCLQRTDGDGLVAIHDGARPLISQELIHRLFSAAEENGNAIPVVPVNESIRQLDGSSNHPVDRSLLRIVQTPQVFQTSLIKQAYLQPFKPAFTDDATVLESLGNPIHLVEGDPANLKITYPADLRVAGSLL
ncbi:MAG: 2-C-methyl-D-erythritol 4-phosphate cytidylyltransferase [Bacteroidales bacterium]|nr:2-C-methyl-D-erythritol 4-phosphate cytidylyltransferase [Bacteroidales bacterium]